jgi:hypothetical protein
VDTYRQLWREELGAEHRSFRWIDRGQRIRWGKFKSVKRFDWALCHVLDTFDACRPDVARAQLVQAMKRMHELANHGSWRLAWRLVLENGSRALAE